MKFKNIFFDFLKTLLWVVIFYSNSTYAVYIFLNPQKYQHTANDFRPYSFERNLVADKMIKITDTENNFQFETYKLGSKIDMDAYKLRVKPILQKWSKKGQWLKSNDSRISARLSGHIESGINWDSNNKVFTHEVHVATY